MSCIQHGTWGDYCGPECARLTRSWRRGNRRPYRLVAGGKTLTWERPISGDSRVDQITCDATWFYAQMIGGDQ